MEETAGREYRREKPANFQIGGKIIKVLKILFRVIDFLGFIQFDIHYSSFVDHIKLAGQELGK